MPPVTADVEPFVVDDPPWMLIDVQYGEQQHGCDHCGVPIKRAFVIEELATGRRLAVGRVCVSEYGIASR